MVWFMINDHIFAVGEKKKIALKCKKEGRRRRRKKSASCGSDNEDIFHNITKYSNLILMAQNPNSNATKK